MSHFPNLIQELPDWGWRNARDPEHTPKTDRLKEKAEAIHTKEVKAWNAGQVEVARALHENYVKVLLEAQLRERRELDDRRKRRTGTSLTQNVVMGKLIRILKNPVSAERWLSNKRKLAEHLGVSYRSLFFPGPLWKMIDAAEGALQ